LETALLLLTIRQALPPDGTPSIVEGLRTACGDKKNGDPKTPPPWKNARFFTSTGTSVRWQKHEMKKKQRWENKQLWLEHNFHQLPNLWIPEIQGEGTG